MKIAVIGVKGLPANQGGIEHYCQALYPRIVERGHTVDLYARSSYVKKPWFSVSEYQGVRVICLPSLPFKGLDALTSSGFAAIVAAFKGYDLVHFHALGPSLFSFIPRLLSSAKVLTTCQGLDWQRGKWGKLSSRMILLGEKMAAKYAHNVIVVSQSLKNYFKKTYDLDAVYIPNGPGIYAESDPNFAFVQSFGLATGKYLLFLGRLVPEKRPELLIQAFQSLNPSDWKLVLAGGNSDTTEYIAELFRISNNNPNIIFAGELKGSHLSEMVRGAGIFALPSDLEGLPLAMLEAMREGIPVLASDIPPHQQLIGEKKPQGMVGLRGFLFSAGSITSCAKAIDRAISQPEALAAMATEAQDYVTANYDWEKITTDNLSVYADDFQLDLTEKASSSSVNDAPVDSLQKQVTQSQKFS
jgi:glycosyltransferase involved in cell wall biosynthesis